MKEVIINSFADFLFGGGPLYITQEALETQINTFFAISSEKTDPQAYGGLFDANREEKEPDRLNPTEDGFARIELDGIMAYDPPWWMRYFYGYTSTKKFAELVEEATDRSDIKGVLVRFATPGGQVLGTTDAAASLKDLAAVKPVVGFSDYLCCSAGYWVGSQCDQLVGSRGSVWGSIGVIGAHVDYTKMREKWGVKVEVFRNKEAKFKSPGMFGTAITDEQREHIQSEYDDIFKAFKQEINSKRSVPDSSMQGQTFTGNRAVEAKLLDRVGTRQSALNTLRFAYDLVNHGS